MQRQGQLGDSKSPSKTQESKARETTEGNVHSVAPRGVSHMLFPQSHVSSTLHPATLCSLCFGAVTVSVITMRTTCGCSKRLLYSTRSHFFRVISDSWVLILTLLEPFCGWAFLALRFGTAFLLFFYAHLCRCAHYRQNKLIAALLGCIIVTSEWLRASRSWLAEFTLRWARSCYAGNVVMNFVTLHWRLS